MRKRWAVSIVASIALAVGSFAGVAYASSTTSDVGGFGLDVKTVQNEIDSPANGESGFKAQCPTGYTPIGGGGFALPPSAAPHIPLLFSAPYDDGNLGWWVMYNIPASSWTVFVYATCLKIS